MKIRINQETLDEINNNLDNLLIGRHSNLFCIRNVETMTKKKRLYVVNATIQVFTKGFDWVLNDEGVDLFLFLSRCDGGIQKYRNICVDFENQLKNAGFKITKINEENENNN